MQTSPLNEVSKMAAVKASAALSKLIQLPVGVDILPASTIQINEDPLFMKPGDFVVNIMVPILGDLKGVAFLFYPKEVALLFCDLLCKRQKGQTKGFEEMEISALNETANIIVGNFLTPFASPLKLTSVLHQAPVFKCETYKNMDAYIVSKVNSIVSQGLLIEIVITLQHVDIKGHLIIILDNEEMKNVLERFKVNK